MTMRLQAKSRVLGPFGHGELIIVRSTGTAVRAERAVGSSSEQVGHYQVKACGEGAADRAAGYQERDCWIRAPLSNAHWVGMAQ